MKRHWSLTTRLSCVFAVLVFVLIGAVGALLYRGLAMQLQQRDDGALIARVDQIRALLQDENARELVRTRPRLFANMLNNPEAMLVLRYPGQPPLVEINPSRSALPQPRVVSADASVTRADVAHFRDQTGTPLSAVAAMATTGVGEPPIEIMAGRLMAERTRLLQSYRNRILLLAAFAALISSAVGFVLIRRGLAPVRRLAGHADSVNTANLDGRIDDAGAPQELLPLIRAFNNMLDRLGSGFTRLSQVSTDLAHDLRTPINNLLGQTQVALSKARSAEEYEQLLASNAEEFERLMRMADNMLFLARSEHQHTELEWQALEIESELVRIADYFEGPALDRDLSIVVSGTGRLHADPVLLRRALANLLANAVRHADEGSVIQVTGLVGPEHVVLAVENHGPGISQALQARLFDRFFRGDSARSDSGQSSGLGLSIVRTIMNLHHGVCRVYCADGITRFELVFPSTAAPPITDHGCAE
ncbi:two-component system heavy metal sensor histidine kinase CusS [Silvimonas terrae]|uniref:Sensor protein n=1 Tax=Silvimonas terrae TaxID=300266 RepID=A0A840RF71_9NEIS|nr:heavy metal sensor histidine kinase [Silvimonas terrae]MBB5190983.1 two-component system heavy metal sensor histidine kinase CusS [Silvimonas terrae]